MKKITSYLKELKLIVIFTVFLWQGLADLLTPINSFFGKAGVVIWFCSFFLMFVFATQQLRYLVENSWRKKSFFTLLSLLVIFSLAIGNLTKKKSLSGETTQEIACNLDHYSNSADWGFRQNCFLGYPNKQFYLPGSMSLLLGRNQLNLNAGSLIYFFLGSLIFAGAILQTLKFEQKNDCLVGMSFATALHFHFFNHFFFNQFEQSIYPLSIGLTAFGLLLFYKKTKKIIYLPLTGIALLWLTFSYTPSLALIPLIILLLILADTKSFSRKKSGVNWLYLGIIIFVVLINLIFSFNYRGDVRLVGDNNRSINLISSELVSLAKHLTYSPQGLPFFSPTFTIVFWLILLLSAFYKTNLEKISLIAWTIITILFAVLSQGYSYYGLDFRTHRALIIFPVIAYLLIVSLNKIKINKYVFFFFYLVILSSGLNFSQHYLNSLQSKTEMVVIDFVESHSPIKAEQKKKTANYLYFTKIAQADLLSFNDYSQYFWPMTQIRELDLENTGICLPEKTSLFFLNIKEDCWSGLKNNLPKDIQVLGYINVKGEDLVLLQKN